MTSPRPATSAAPSAPRQARRLHHTRAPLLVLVLSIALAAIIASPNPMIAATTAQDGSLGVSPAEIQIANAQEGQAYLRTVTIQNQLDTPTVFRLSTAGDLAPWTTLTPSGQIEVPAYTNQAVTVRLDIPEDAPGGGQSGGLSIVAEPSEQPENSGLATSWGVTVLLSVATGGAITKGLAWSDAEAPDVEVGTPPQATVAVVNTGNVLDTASAHAHVLAFDEDEVLQETQASGTVLPGQRLQLDFPFTETLPQGQYRMRIRADAPEFYEATVPFKVVPPGALGKDGLLRYIEHDAWAYPGDVVKIDAVFDNIGTALIARATFTAEIHKGDRLVGVIESEPRVVRIGETANLTGYFTPQQHGQHTITGRVNYDGFETLESESVLNVERAVPNTASLLPWIALGLLLAVGTALFVWKTRAKGTQESRRTRPAHPGHRRGP